MTTSLSSHFCFKHSQTVCVRYEGDVECPFCELERKFAQLDRTYQQLLDEVRSLNVNEL